MISNNDKKSIELILLSGFLGSGKTTVLNKILKSENNDSVGVLMNEFGSIDIDGQILKSNDDMQLVSVTNGSIFCACKQDAFLDGLTELSNTGVDRILVECSGMADPGNVYSLIKLIDVPIIIKGIICLLDVQRLPLVDLLTAIKQQLKMADTVILSKCDLVEDDIIKVAKAKVREYNNYAKIYIDYDIKVIIDNLSNDNNIEGETSNTKDNRPSSVILQTKHNFSQSELEKVFRNFPITVYRAKGFLKVDDKYKYIDYVQGQLNIMNCSETLKMGKIVIIGEQLADFNQKLKESFEKVIKTTCFIK